MNPTDTSEDFVLIDAGVRTDCIDAARTLMQEYIRWLGIDLSFQNVEEELAALPGAYLAPRGGLWLAVSRRCNASPSVQEGEVAGVIALRPLELLDQFNAGEVKRLWVRPDFRGQHLGERLAQHLLDCARTMGYRSLYLDTLARMTPAIRLYQSLGFKACEPYYANPEKDVVYMRCDLEA